MLEELEAAEILEIRIFHPALDCLLIRKVVGVFEIVQPDHEPRWLRWSTRRFEELAKALIESRPRHGLGQTNQGVLHIDDRIEPFAKQIEVTTARADRLH